jgi:pyruvate/2-oxoglutarate dehydrogenase complex dihydrolipoamide acyltransferase (E2) component
MPKEKNFHIRKFSSTRRILADYNYVAASLNRIYGLIEIDVTEALEKIEEIEKKDNYKVSFTGWAVKCVSQAVIVVFDDVDISVIIELTTRTGKKVPYNYVIRKAETKSVKTITDEIRAAQSKKIDGKDQLTRDTSTYLSFYSILPRFFRRFVIRTLISNPFYLKKLIGTVGITSLGMFIKGQGAWGVPFPDKTMNIALGGIKDNVVIREGKTEERKLLCTTILMNHDLIDGAPATRFISRLTELMGDTSYLDDLEKI